MNYNHLMIGWIGINTDGPVHCIEDGVRVELEEFDYGTGEGFVTEYGTVRHDLGGENVPVWIDGKNDPAIPHDYTAIPRRMIVRTFLGKSFG